MGCWLTGYKRLMLPQAARRLNTRARRWLLPAPKTLNRGSGRHAVGAGLVLPLALSVVVARYGARGVHHRGAVAAQHEREDALGGGGRGIGLRVRSKSGRGA